LILAYVKAFNSFDMDRLRSLFTSDARINGVLGHGTVDFAEPIWLELHHGLQIHLEPAASKAYELTGMEWFEIKDGKISSRRGARDSAALNRQIG
jgi:hypothetical protein